MSTKFIPWILFAGAIIVIALMKSCGSPGGAVTIKRDTVIIKLPPDTVHLAGKPVPYEVIRHGKTDTLNEHDTSIIYRDLPVDSAAIVSDFFDEKHYRDTFRTKNGYVIVMDTVKQNELTGQAAIFHMEETQITNTVIEQKRKGYFGFNAGFGNAFAMGGVHFTYIDKKDNEWGVQGDWSTLGTPIVQARVGWKLNFHIFK